MNLKDYLFSINLTLKEIILQPINFEGVTIGFNVVVFDSSGYPYSGGTHENKDTAIRIAIAEGIERSIFDILKKNSEYSQFLELDNFPSTGGFAAGFDQELTKKRSIYEAIERWAWSKWIDDGYNLEILDSSTVVLNKIGEKLIGLFDDTIFFERVISFKNIKLKFSVLLGIQGDGVFPGSRVCDINDNGFNHAVVEAYRNLNNFIGKSLSKDGDIIEKRILYFSTNKQKAFEQINNSIIKSWPNPKLKFSHEIPTGHKEVFLFRSLCDDFIGWHKGDETRFVY